ncbi:MAG: virulence factor family protein [Rhizobiales bacterium]|nr:virulence factor family protein [Hyphomicrobiales bacterium]
MKLQLAAALLATALASPAFADADAPPPVDHFVAGTVSTAEGGLLGKPKVFLPSGAVTGAVFLFSDAKGWSADEEAAATKLQGEGAIVVGVETPVLFASLEKDSADECVYLVSDIEDLSHRIQRALNTENYSSPIVAGVGEAGALGLAIAAQTPDATMGHTVSVDPTLAISLVKTLCTDAPHVTTNGQTVYGLAPDDLTNPVDVYFTAAAPADGKAHVAELQAKGFAIKSKAADGKPYEALQARLDHLVTPRSEADNPLADLPLIALPAKPLRNTMAIVYSGDGGWRDLDKSIGDVFQKEGVPTVGIDSLRYFWSKKTPDQTAADLARIIDVYTEEWGVNHVILVGYSFGADVLPSAYNGLPDVEKAQVAQMSLLGLSDQVDYEISVGAFLGTSSGDGQTLPEIAKIKPGLIQCVYGEDEDDSACTKLQGTSVELIKTTGGHHFDGDYEALANKILDGLKRRVAGHTGYPIAEK